VIAGDGPARWDLERQVAALGLTAHVMFTGWVAAQAVWTLLNTATVVVMPSREEGYGMTAIEAAVMGRPVVGAAVGGLPEALAYGEHGHLVPPDDTSALASAVEWLIEHPDRARALGARGRANVMNRTPDTLLDAYDTLYAAVASGASPAGA
jgi:glycosyltransferase involved in cell wall biosynthesis